MVKTQTHTKAKVLTAITVAAAGVAAYAVGMLPLNQQTDTSGSQLAQCQNVCAAQQDSCTNAVMPSADDANACVKAFNACVDMCAQQFPARTTAVAPTAQSGYVVRPSSSVIKLPDAYNGQNYDLMLVLENQFSSLQWKLAGGVLPQGMNLDEGGHIYGMMSGVGQYQFTLNMHSPSGATADMAQVFSIYVNPPSAPVATATTPLRLVSQYAPAGLIDAPYSFQFAATGGSTVGFNKWKVVTGNLPPGLQLSEGGLISGTPTRMGIYTATILVDRVATASSPIDETRGLRQEITINIQPGSAVMVPLRIQTTSLPAATVGTIYTYQLAAVGGRGEYHWDSTGEMPIGMTINQYGLLVGTPSRAGSYAVMARVTAAGADTPPSSSSAPFVLVVNPAPSNLAITSQTLASGKVGVPYSQSFHSTGGQEPIVWTAPTGRPPGLTMSTDGVLSGTPTREGVYTIRVKATDPQVIRVADVVINIVDGQSTLPTEPAQTTDQAKPADNTTQPAKDLGTVEKPAQVAVEQPVKDQPAVDQPVTNTTTDKKEGTVQQPVDTTPTTDQEKDKLALNNPVDTGTTVTKDDKVTTPTTDNKDTGTTVDTKTTGVTQPVAFINVGSYPDGFVSYYYNARPFDVTGGSGAYTWSVISGSLPNGLTMGDRGEIAGTPSKTGSFAFVTQVQDEKGEKVRANRTITIRAATENTTVVNNVVNSNDPQLAARLAKLRSIGVNIHDLIKLQDDGNADTQYDTTVYYIGTDGRRHAFPNNHVYFTWFPDYSRVRVIAPYDLSDIQLGANITYRPGIRLVKFMTNGHVYAVDTQRRLRWIRTADVAERMFGSSWMYGVDDISDAFYLDYQFGSDISSPSDFSSANAANNTVYPSQVLPE